MDDDHFLDTLARSLTNSGSRRRALAASVGSLLAFSVLPLEAKRKKKKRKKKKIEELVTLCVNGQTLTVPESVALSLIAQGATYGACPPPPPPCVPTCGAAQCGPDGCGGTCGTCNPSSQQCCNCGPTRPGECLGNFNTCEILCNVT